MATPEMPLSILELREVVIIGVVLSYVFASGKIADFVEARGFRISKKEVLLAPFAYMFVSAIGVLAYFASGAYLPPQDTIITLAVFLVLLPLAIATGLGALALHYFFRDRLNIVQSLDLSLRILLAPIFDGWKGYWTALGAAGILVAISAISYYSSGLSQEKTPLDFLLLAIIAALYFVYRALTATNNEARASGFVSALTILAPAILLEFFRNLACGALALVPFGIFSSCPLDQAGNEVTLALSVLATLLLLIPVIPLVYAIVVNLLRFLTAIEVILRKEEKKNPSELKE